MKKLIFLFATILTLSAYGQERERKWQVGINFSPDYCYRTLKSTNSNGPFWYDGMNASQYTISIRNEIEVAKFGYTAGLNICYNFNRHFGLEIGTQYSNNGAALDTRKVKFGDYAIFSNGFTPSNSKQPELKSYHFNYYYLDVPVRAIFSFGTKRVRFITSIGVVTNFFLNATTSSVIKYPDDHTQKSIVSQDKDYFNSINVSPMASVGIDYRISNQLHLRAEPTFRHNVLSITNKNYPLNNIIAEYLWSAGVNVSCYYKF